MASAAGGAPDEAALAPAPAGCGPARGAGDASGALEAGDVGPRGARGAGDALGAGDAGSAGDAGGALDAGRSGDALDAGGAAGGAGAPRVLLVRLSAIGDVVHALPALARLRAALPRGRIAWAVERAAAPLLEGHPGIDDLVVIDRRAPLAAARAIARLRGLALDLAIDLQGLLRSAVVARLAGARAVVGPAWAREGAPLLYSRRLRGVPRPGEAHAVARYVAIVERALEHLALPDALAARAALVAPEPHAPTGLARAERAGAGVLDHVLRVGPESASLAERPALALLPGAGKPANRPPPALLAAIADRVAAARGDVEVWLVGGPADRAAAADVAARCRVARPTTVAGALDLAASARRLATASVVVGGDTGPLHVARALGRPVIGLFHAADPARTGPGGLPGAAPWAVFAGRAPCAPCCARRCRRGDRIRICLDALDPCAIAAAALALLPPRT